VRTCLKLLCLHNNESRNARSKTKIRGYPIIYINNRTVQPARQVLCFLSYLLKKESRKSFRLCENKKKNIEYKNMALFMIITLFVITSDQRERGNPWKLAKRWDEIIWYFTNCFVLVCNNEKSYNLKFKALKKKHFVLMDCHADFVSSQWRSVLVVTSLILLAMT
jgi:hypothetical protein